MQDRPMFGGNASSEIRMWVCGAHGQNNKETGLVEEFKLENFHINPMRNYFVWDSVLYEKVAAEKNIKFLLNCACCEADCVDNDIKSITGYQTTTQQWHEINADIFIDCSGDSVLANLVGAEYRIGRESCDEFNEDIAPKVADKLTMGMSCLIQARNTGRKSVFTTPKRAYKYTKDDLPHRNPMKDLVNENFWYIELGGMQDSIRDTEILRDELLRTAFGIWDYIKNSGNYEVDNWELDWIGILPGKRESLRYVGDYIVNQNDVRQGGQFEDIIAYGGWTMDDHHPGGFLSKEQPTIYHAAPSPYGLPYRSIYSKNIKNLMFAGRNISVTHSALSSTRVMATCGLLGQAAGVAAMLCVKNDVMPRDVYENKPLLENLQQILMDQDCFLPFLKRDVSELTKKANIAEKYEVLRNGFDRPTPIGIIKENGEYCKKIPVNDEKSKKFDENSVLVVMGEQIVFNYNNSVAVSGMRFVFDSDLNMNSMRVVNAENVNMYSALTHNMMASRPLNFDGIYPAQTMITDLLIEFLSSEKIVEKYNLTDNYQRLVEIKLDKVLEKIDKIVVTPLKTSGKEEKYIDKANIFSIDIL